MIIGYVLDDTLDKPDGVQQAVLDIGIKMASLGHEVHYIVTETSRTDIKNIHSVGRFFSLRFNGNSVRTPLPASKQKIQKLFTDIKFDVLHIQMPYSPLLGERVLRYAPAEVVKVGTFHILPYNFIARNGTKLLGTILRRTLKNLDHRFAVSRPALDFMKSAFRVEGSVLPNPVDYKFYQKYKKNKKSDKNVIFLGRFDKRKGVRQLLNAYSALPKNIQKQTKLTMCGKGPLWEEIKQKATELKLNINLPGFVSEVQKAEYFSKANVAVFPSISGESFGIVLTEAMSAGAGVVLGGDNPGYSSVLGSWPEVLFNPSNTAEFADKLELFITDKDLRTRIGQEQAMAVKQYDIDEVIKELLVAYKTKKTANST